MAVVYVDGFDMYNGVQTAIGLQSRYNISATGQYGNSTTTPFSNGRSLQIVGDVQFNVGSCRRVLPSTYATSCIGFHLYFSNVNSCSSRSNSAFVYTLQGGTTQFGLQLLSTGILVLNRYNGTGTISAELCRTTVPVSSATWYHIGIVFTIGNTADISLYIDGSVAASATGVDTQNTANAWWDEIFFYNFTLGGGPSTLVDDLYVTDAATFLGIRRVETLRPDADTATKTWTPNSGSVNYSRVNETLVDGDTTYVETSTIGNQDLYDLGALSSIPTTIDAVQVVSFARRTDATARTQYNSVKSGATGSDGTAFALAATYSHYPRLLNLNPDGSVAWTGAAVNALQVGPKLAS